MGLPRSNLLKPKSPAVAFAAPSWTPPAVPANIFTAPPGVSAREPFCTTADSIEIAVESQRAPATEREPPPGVVMPAPLDMMRGQYASSPSTRELLERAASLGPARMTWESIVLPDPILDEKRQPHVAERRARLTRMVKIGLSACLGVCVLALGVSALSSDASPPAAAAATTVGKSVPSKGIIPVEPLDGTKHAKAVRRAAPAVTTAAIGRSKRR